MLINSRQQTHLFPDGMRGIQFRPEALEVTVLDRRGHVLWRHLRSLAEKGSLLWNGLDLAGCAVEPGSYTCKIVYAVGKTVYIPFVLMC